jgi:hypothetical protein
VIIPGMIDFHAHPSPDVVERRLSDRELAQRFRHRGLGGAVLKSHHFETAARAANLRSEFPELILAGGIVLNNTVGGVNPVAVEQMAKLGGQVVWMPTLDARSYRSTTEPNQSLDSSISLTGDRGELEPAVFDVLEVARQYDLVVSTGHVSVDEGLRLIEAASQMKIDKLVVTHADNCNTHYPMEARKACAGMGAVIEHSYFTVFYGRTPVEKMCADIREIGVENVLLDSDFGQPASPYPDEGMDTFLDLLNERDFTARELSTMVVDTPKRLLAQ